MKNNFLLQDTAIYISSLLLVLIISCSRLEYQVIDQKSEVLNELQQDNTYLIGCGDILKIDVWRYPEVSTDTVVRPDGKISMPLIGDVMAVGLTVDELRDTIDKKISAYISEPHVSVMVKEIKSLKIYVIGEVVHPGQFDLVSYTDVLQALSMAGGFTIYAKKDNISIFRKDGNKKIKIKFNYNQVVKGKHLDQNIPLKPGDVILVP